MDVIAKLAIADSNTTPNALTQKYDSQMIASFSVEHGKLFRFDTSRAGYCVITVLSGPDDMADLEIGRRALLQVNNGTTDYELFSGYITDISRSVVASDLTAYSITLTDVLGKLANSESNFEYPSQSVSARVEDILLDGLNSLPIDALSDTINDNTGTIGNWFGYAIAADPDSFTTTLVPYADGVTNALGLADEYANMAQGTIICDNDGFLRYRPYGFSSGYSKTIGPEHILKDTLTGVTNYENAYTWVQLTGTYQKDLYQIPRIRQFGKRIYSLYTEFALEASANTAAANILAAVDLDNLTLQNVTIQMNSFTTDAEFTDVMLAGMFGGDITLTGLPIDLVGTTTYTARVIGWGYSFNNGIFELNLNLAKQ